MQDESAGLVVALLDPQPGERILDACAAPGGKTLYAALRMCGQVRLSCCHAAAWVLLPMSCCEVPVVSYCLCPAVRCPAHAWTGATAAFTAYVLLLGCYLCPAACVLPYAALRMRGQVRLLLMFCSIRLLLMLPVSCC